MCHKQGPDVINLQPIDDMAQKGVHLSVHSLFFIMMRMIANYPVAEHLTQCYFDLA